MADATQPITPGMTAPDFSLPAVEREAKVSLADYRGRHPLLLAVFRGLWCPFCRRAIADLGTVTDRLRALGVETLAVVATDVDNARLYFKHRPTKVPLAADPDCTVHRAYGVPKAPMNEETMAALAATKVNPTGELREPLPIVQAAQALDELTGFKPSTTDGKDFERQAGQLKGQFLIDREGIVRWVNIEAARGLEGFGKFPTADELVHAARSVV
jgi:peroxiredoxin